MYYGYVHRPLLAPRRTPQGPRVFQCGSECNPQQRTGLRHLACPWREFVTIGKYKGNTLVFIPSHDTFYFASPVALLSQECPDNTVLMGQFIVDMDKTPRILIFDVAKMQGVTFNDMPPRERYTCLQRLVGCLGPIYTLQWVGECKVLAADLQSGKFKVPHAVKGVMALTLMPGRLVMI